MRFREFSAPEEIDKIKDVQKYSGKIRCKLQLIFYSLIIMQTFHYIFSVVDSHWVCINHQDEKRVLCDFLKDHGFGDLPDWIHYCIAENYNYRLKYWLINSKIHIYLLKL